MINFILDWIWQLPQNLIGLIYAAIIYEEIVDKNYDKDRNYYIFLTKNSGGVSLGKFTFSYYKAIDLDCSIAHEYGHTKQSRYLGPLYLLVVGLPSLIWALLHTSKTKRSYYDFYTESWANKLGGVKEENGILIWDK